MKITSQKTVFKGLYFEVKENKLDFGNGVLRTHHDIYRAPAVSVFPLTESYEIYLIRQYRYILGKEITEAIAGMVDGDESPIEAAKRELQEEAGITAQEVTEMRQVSIGASFYFATQHLILAKGLTVGESHPEETERITRVKLSLDEAVQKVMQGEISTASSIIGILLLNEMRQRGEI